MSSMRATYPNTFLGLGIHGNIFVCALQGHKNYVCVYYLSCNGVGINITWARMQVQK